MSQCLRYSQCSYRPAIVAYEDCAPGVRQPTAHRELSTQRKYGVEQPRWLRLGEVVTRTQVESTGFTRSISWRLDRISDINRRIVLIAERNSSNSRSTNVQTVHRSCRDWLGSPAEHEALFTSRDSEFWRRKDSGPDESAEDSAVAIKYGLYMQC